MELKSLVGIKQALVALHYRIYGWKDSKDRYRDLFTLAELRRENRGLLLELRALEENQPLDEQTRIDYGATIDKNSTRIDTLIVGSFYVLLGNISTEGIPNELINALRVIDYQIVTVVSMNLETEDTLTSLLKEAIEFMALLINVGQEQSPLYEVARQAYMAIKDRGRTKYKFDFGQYPLPN